MLATRCSPPLALRSPSACSTDQINKSNTTSSSYALRPFGCVNLLGIQTTEDELTIDSKRDSRKSSSEGRGNSAAASQGWRRSWPEPRGRSAVVETDARRSSSKRRGTAAVVRSPTAGPVPSCCTSFSPRFRWRRRPPPPPIGRKESRWSMEAAG